MPPPYPSTPYQQQLYDALYPLAYDDANQGYDLFIYCGALARMCDQIETYARDTDDGKPGWSILLDVDRCPTEALGWLAQFVGVKLNPVLSDADQRARIRSTDGFKRGTIGAMVGAAQQFLTGSKTVYVKERDSSVSSVLGGAYGLTILTLASETPDSAAVLAALQSQKPAGVILAYNTVTGMTWQLVNTTYASWNAVKTAFVTWNGVRNNAPGT